MRDDHHALHQGQIRILGKPRDIANGVVLFDDRSRAKKPHDPDRPSFGRNVSAPDQALVPTVSQIDLQVILLPLKEKLECIFTISYSHLTEPC